MVSSISMTAACAPQSQLVLGRCQTRRSLSVTATAEKPKIFQGSKETSPDRSAIPSLEMSGRRHTLLMGAALTAATCLVGPVQPSHAVGFKKELKKRKIPAEEYTQFGDSLKIYDLSEGRGDDIQQGDRIVVHFDCYFRGIDAVSSRNARLLGGNRTIAEPYELVAGKDLPKVRSKKVDFDDRAGGLFTAAGGPKPPPALPMSVIGMKVGGKRSVLVPAELAYGSEGVLEIPPNASIELQIEILEKK